MSSLKQLIEVSMSVTCSSSAIIGHILASFPDTVSEQGVIDVELSDLQLIFTAFENLQNQERIAQIN